MRSTWQAVIGWRPVFYLSAALVKGPCLITGGVGPTTWEGGDRASEPLDLGIGGVGLSC